RAERGWAGLGPPLYLRFGGAAIALACALLVGQQLIRNHTTTQPFAGFPVADNGRDPSSTTQPDSKGTAVVPEAMAPGGSVSQGGERQRNNGPMRYKGGAVLHNAVAISTQTDPGASAAAVLLMRGPSAESEVIVPAVSLGAQPIFYSYTEPQPSRIVRTRF